MSYFYMSIESSSNPLHVSTKEDHVSMTETLLKYGAKKDSGSCDSDAWATGVTARPGVGFAKIIKALKLGLTD